MKLYKECVLSKPNNEVFLISADLPGCGSSTLVSEITDRHQGEVEPHVIRIGDAIRKALNVTTEAELKERLKEINDPHAFDPQFYGNLPDDRLCIIDGKLATTVGPQYIDPGQREVTAVDLTGHPLTSAKRITQRETGLSFPEIIFDPEQAEQLLGRFALIKARADHDQGLRRKMHTDVVHPVSHNHRIDTSRLSREEVVNLVVPQGVAFDEEVPDWELEALIRTAADLSSARHLFDGQIHQADDIHFRYHLEGIKYKTDRLGLMLGTRAIASVRDDLRKTIIDGWSSLMMKNAPRFFTDEDGKISMDKDSFGWTPEYYKIAEAWPIFSEVLKGKSVLDPFAGAGTLTNLLAARNIPSKIFSSDISYEGGRPLEGSGKLYAPDLNRRMWEALFDELPSWYKPDHSTIEASRTSDARQLPFQDKSIDYIVTDPPYGKNCPGGLDLLHSSLREMKRVTKEGSILLVPEEWVDKLKEAGHSITQLTRDVSRGTSSLPTCYIYVDSRNAE